MKQFFVIAVCVGISGCTGPSSSPRSGDTRALTERETNQIPQTRESGITISGQARFGVVRHN